MQPNEFNGVVDELEEPIESVALLAGGQHLACCSHDTLVRIYNISEDGSKNNVVDEDQAADNSNTESENEQEAQNEPSDMDSDDSNESLDDDRHKRRKRRKEKSIKRIQSFAQDNRRKKAAEFFGDLVDDDE